MTNSKPTLLDAAESLAKLARRPAALDARTGTSIAAGSVGLGVLGDALFYHAAPGLNVLLWTAGFVAVFVVSRSSTRRPPIRQVALLAAAVQFSAMVAWRGSTTLQALDILAVGGCLSLAVALPQGAGLRRISLLGLGVVGAGTLVGLAAAVPRVIIDGEWTRRLGVRSRENTLVASRVLLLTAPLVLGFGGLFVAADAVFRSHVEDLFRLDPLSLWEHAFWFFGAAWAACGLLWLGLVVELPYDAELNVPSSTRLRALETGIVLGSLAVLFGAFVVVQVRYLFGGESLVEETINLTYAEYARRGFFELVAASALLLPVLLAVDWARHEGRRSSRVFKLLALVLVVLLFVVMASAVERMRVYMDAFGLTELRVYVVTFLLCLAGVFIWFLWAILRDRRQEFVLGAGVAFLIGLVALNVARPDAVIARTNTSRLQEGRTFDAYHASLLGPEAAPVLAARIALLEPDDACRVRQA